MGTDWIFYIFLFIVLVGIIAALYVGFKSRLRWQKQIDRVRGGVDEDIKEERLGKKGPPALDKEELSDTLPQLRKGLLECFVLEGGRYRVGNHWLCEGFDEEKITRLCFLISGSANRALLTFCHYGENGDLSIMLRGASDDIVINKTVLLGDAMLTARNFCDQVSTAWSNQHEESNE